MQARPTPRHEQSSFCPTRLPSKHLVSPQVAWKWGPDSTPAVQEPLGGRRTPALNSGKALAHGCNPARFPVGMLSQPVVGDPSLPSARFLQRRPTSKLPCTTPDLTKGPRIALISHRHLLKRSPGSTRHRGHAARVGGGSPRAGCGIDLHSQRLAAIIPQVKENLWAHDKAKK